MQTQFFDEAIVKLKNIEGIDLIYLLNENHEIIKEYRIAEANNNYLEQILNIIKSNFNSLATPLDSNQFHTYTLLNEAGLVIISKIENLYLVIIAGENDPVDLINLLKTCKEIRVGVANHQM